MVKFGSVGFLLLGDVSLCRSLGNLVESGGNFLLDRLKFVCHL